VEASYTLFSTTGVPIRATCRLQLHEIPSKTKGQNPTSGALTAQRVHRVVAGDSLQSLAWREYGNAAAWRSIAEANGIDNPGHLPTGTELVLPAAEEVRT
jgi:nucleoid-associated protein YgaU